MVNIGKTKHRKISQCCYKRVYCDASSFVRLKSRYATITTVNCALHERMQGSSEKKIESDDDDYLYERMCLQCN